MSTRKRSVKPGGIAPWKVLATLVVAGTVTAILAGAAMWFLSADTSGLPPADPNLSTFNRIYLRAMLRLNTGSLNEPSARADGVFEVRPDESASTICTRLQAEGWVPSADTVCQYLVYMGGDRTIGSGMYLIRTGDTPRAIANSLSGGSGKVRVLTVFAGWRREEIGDALAASGIPISGADFMAASSGRPGAGGNLDGLYAEIPGGASLEGFLFPQGYNVLPGENASSLVTRMVQAFRQAVSPDLESTLQSHGLTFYQSVTLASIIQRETLVEDEMPTIASVFYNRLTKGMRLQTDPTVQYALGYQPSRGKWWANPLTSDDFGLDSPYNTYIYFGLPPGPISNPSLAALQAVANPDSTPYLFFTAVCDGSGRHLFAETNAQHNANICSN